MITLRLSLRWQIPFDPVVSDSLKFTPDLLEPNSVGPVAQVPCPLQRFLGLRGDGRVVLYRRPTTRNPNWTVRLKIPETAGFVVKLTKTTDDFEAMRFAEDLYYRLEGKARRGEPLNSPRSGGIRRVGQGTRRRSSGSIGEVRGRQRPTGRDLGSPTPRSIASRRPSLPTTWTGSSRSRDDRPS